MGGIVMDPAQIYNDTDDLLGCEVQVLSECKRLGDLIN